MPLSAIFNEAQVSETAYCSIDISSELFTSLFVNNFKIVQIKQEINLVLPNFFMYHQKILTFDSISLLDCSLGQFRFSIKTV